MRSWWAATPSTRATVNGSGATDSAARTSDGPESLHLALVEQRQGPFARLVAGPFSRDGRGTVLRHGQGAG